MSSIVRIKFNLISSLVLTFFLSAMQLQAQELIEKFNNKVNGNVWAIATDDVNDIIYLGGAFTRAGNLAAYGGVLNPVDGLVTGTNFPNGPVLTSYPDGNGGYYIGGNFTKVGNEERYRFAHINAAGGLTDLGKELNLNGLVRSIVKDGSQLYLGGDFTAFNAYNESKGALLNQTDGSVNKQFPKVNGTINATASDGNGGYYIGGFFTQVGGEDRNNLAHIEADGSVSAWNPNADNTVLSLTVSGTTVYAGGVFTSIAGVTRNRLAAVDKSTGMVTAWDPNASGSVRSIVVSGTTVYAGGQFTAIGGTTRNRLAAIDANTGAATAWDPGANSTVYSLVISGSTVYAGGQFTSIGGSTRNYIAALDASTGGATAWNPNASGIVFSLALSGSTVYAGGGFASIGGAARNKLAAIDASTGAATAWDPSANSTVRTLVLSGSTVYAGGHFTSIGGATRNRIAAIDASSGTATAWDPNASNQVYSLSVSGSTVYAGGVFNDIGGTARNRIAAIDATTGTPTAWNPDANNGVYSLAVSGATVYAGGTFTAIGGTTRNRLAAIDANTGAATAWDPGANSNVNSLVISGSTVYVGGQFTSIGGATRNRIAAIDASSGTATAWNPNASSIVYSLAISGSTVYAGGGFTTIGGTARNRIAAIDVTTGTPTAWNPNANNIVYSVVVSGGTVYTGGNFTTIGGTTRNRLAAIDVSTGTATVLNPSASSTVNSLAVSGSTVYAGGSFTSIGGGSRNRLAALDKNTGEITSWNPNADDFVFSLALSGSILYAGGNFTSIGGVTRNRIAALDTSTGTATAWDPNANNQVWSLEVSGSTIYTAGNFTSVGGASRSRIAALDASTGEATAWDPNANNLVYSLVVSGSTIYAGGFFTSIGGASRSRIAALDASTGLATTWDPSASSTVRTLRLSGSTVYAGGDFTSIGGSTRNYIAALDAITGEATAWDPNANGSVYSLTVSGSILYAGGNFTSMGGVTRNRIAALDTSAGTTTAWNPNANSIVFSLATSGTTVYAGGGFTGLSNQSGGFFAGLRPPMIDQTITFGTLTDKTYGDADFALSGSSDSGLGLTYTSSNSAVATVVGSTVTIVSAGTTTITASQAGDDTYAPAVDIDQILTINKASLSATADDNSKFYGADNPALTITYSGFVNGDNASEITEPSISTVVTETSGVGTYDISLSGGASTNYNFTLNNGILTVNEVPLTVSADAKSKGYGDSDPALTFQVIFGALVGGDAFTGELTRAAGEDVGTYAIAQNTVTAGSNYTITYEAADLTINPVALTVTADTQSKTYGDSDPNLSYQLTLGALVGGDNFTGELSRAAGEDAGTYAIDQNTLAAGSNYTITYESADLTINPASLTVTADNQSKTYGEADPTLAYQVTSGALVGGDTFTGELSRASGEDVGTYLISQNTLSAGPNYDITFEAANMTINTAALTITADAVSKTYGETDPSLTFQVTSGALIGGDEFSGELSRMGGEDVGTYAISQNTLTAGANYDITFEPADLTINTAALTVTADAVSKTYGETDPNLTFQVTSGILIGGDIFSGELSRTAGEDAGTYAISQNTLNAGSNYLITYESADFTIDPVALTIAADAKSKTYGDTDPAFTFMLTSGSLLSGDAFLGELSREAGEDAGAYEITQNTLTAGDNYTITYEPTQLTIDKAILTYMANNDQFNVGEPLPELTYSVSGFVLGETEAVVDVVPMINTSATISSPRGSYPIGFSGGTDENYDFVFIAGELIITGPVYNLPVSVVFDNVIIGESQTKQVNLVNDGDGAWEISAISLPDNAYTIDQTSLVVNEGSSAIIEVTFLPTEAQMYAGDLVITSNNGEDRIVLTGEGLMVSSIDDNLFNADYIKVYPNPVAGQLLVDLGSVITTSYDIRLINSNGKEVKVMNGLRQSQLTLNVSEYEQGVYLLHITSAEGRAIMKVLIER